MIGWDNASNHVDSKISIEYSTLNFGLIIMVFIRYK